MPTKISTLAVAAAARDAYIDRSFQMEGPHGAITDGQRNSKEQPDAN